MKPVSLIIEAKLTAKSARPTREKIAPYREALVVDEWRVQKVIEGRFRGKTIRVARWALVDARPQPAAELPVGTRATLRLQPFDEVRALQSVYRSDTLSEDFDAPLYFDAGEEPSRRAEEPARRAEVPSRWDYNCGLSDKMAPFLLLKDQLKLVALGDSRTMSGIRAELFYSEQNRRTPVAYNLGVESSDLELQALLIRDYLRNLPRLEWVVYGLSPRVMNGRWSGPDKTRQLKSSPSYRYDRTRGAALWKAAYGPVVTVEQITASRPARKQWEENPWGGYDRTDRRAEGKDVRNAIDEDERGRWQWDDSRGRLLEDLAEELGGKKARMLLFTPPIHPVTAKRDVVDDDGTTRAGYAELVSRLQALEAKHANLHFLDVHRGGRHGFSPDHFRDFDHLNRAGADRLTRMLDAFRQRVEREKP